MRRPRPRVLAAPAALLFCLAALVSCGDTLTSPRLSPSGPLLAVGAAPSHVVISQVYGGGGNSGATYKNDFIELFNPGPTDVPLDGWSVQYASAAGNTWQVTPLSGTIEAGRYYLVQEAAGTGGTVSLPGPNATGTIAMGGTAGKVWLVSSTAPLSGTCPTGFVDQVSYGSTASDCGRGRTATLSNTTAALRSNSGCAYSGTDLASVFTAATPVPRNSATDKHSCGPSVAVSPATIALDVGETQQFTAAERDGDGNPVSTTFGWSSSNPATASIDENGLATAHAPGSVTISATASDGTVGTATLTVNTPPPPGAGDLIISQVYGGGGNSGATYKNDFIELFNRSMRPVSVDGWSVQYTSSGGTSWSAVTPLSGIIPAGSYYLVHQAAGTGGTTSLPDADATGTIAMGATAGKVALMSTIDAVTVPCPTAMDLVPYGSTNCDNDGPGLSNTTAALRRAGGCVYSNNASADFVTGSPAPRNSGSQPRTCRSGILDHVSLTGTTAILVGATTQLTAIAQDGFDVAVPGATISWLSSNPDAVSVNNDGLVSGIVATATPVTITASAVAGGITKSATIQITVTKAGINWIDVSSSTASLPPGFQTQLFATARQSDGGTVIPATFTFEAVDPQYATVQAVQNTGIVTAVAAPADPSTTRPGFRITATPIGGGDSYSFVSRSVTVETPVTASPSIYATNDEFGHPTPATMSNPNDFLIRRDQYTLSYNQSRGTPNWVAYEIDGTRQRGGEDRCNCFSADPLLPADKRILTSDYTNGGYDRGHMTRSADRTVANVDNATTFYLTNIVPQTGDLNQGVWAQFENALGDSAEAGRAVYIITGPLYSRSPLTFIKNEGKVAIPDATWKVALIGPRNGGNPFTRANVRKWEDLAGLTILAVSMPNITGVRNNPWSMYLTTARKIEEATNYDFLSVLETAFEEALEFNDHPPEARFSVSGAASEPSVVTLDASATEDKDLGRSDLGRPEALTYDWTFPDGSRASGPVVTKSFASYGSYKVTLVVTDAFGWPDTLSQPLSIANVPPAVADFAGATILRTETYSAAGSFADPGAGPWTATVDYGDGSGVRPLALSGRTFGLRHTYERAGTFTVLVRVADGDATGSRSATVIVETPAQGVANLVEAANALDALDKGEINSLTAKLRAASAQLSGGEANAAANTLSAFVNELEALARSRRLSSGEANPPIAYARRVIAAIRG